MTTSETNGRGTSADRAHARILAGIIDGTYPAGEMLSESELAAQIGVSRTPIRAALARLRDDGWITVYPKRGALVRALTPDEIADLTDARLVLESSGVSRATPGERKALAERLRHSVDRQQEALAAGDVGSFIDAALAFHRSFVEAGGNRYFIEMCDHFGDRQRQLLFTKRDVLLQGSQEIIDEHRQLLRHLRHDDPAAFGEALQAHLSGTHDLRLGAL